MLNNLFDPQNAFWRWVCNVPHLLALSVFPGLSPADALRELGDYVRVLHIHDSDGQSDRHWIPGKGVIDWADFGRALKEVNYQGVFSLETSPSSQLPMQDAEKMYADMLEIAKEIVIH